MQSWPQLALWVDADSIDAILGPLLMLSIIGALVWFGYRRWRLSYGAKRWTLTEAIIQSETRAIQPTLAWPRFWLGARPGLW